MDQNVSTARTLPTLDGTISNLALGTDKKGRPYARMNFAYTSNEGKAKNVTAVVFNRYLDAVRPVLANGATVRFSGLFDGGTYKVMGLPVAKPVPAPTTPETVAPAADAELAKEVAAAEASMAAQAAAAPAKRVRKSRAKIAA